MMRSERTQVVGHLAEFTDNRCIPEIAGGRIARPAKGKRTDIAGLARQGLSPSDRTVRVEAFHAGGEPVVRQYKGRAT
jgi:hypothetical protein